MLTEFFVDFFGFFTIVFLIVVLLVFAMWLYTPFTVDKASYFDGLKKLKKNYYSIDYLQARFLLYVNFRHDFVILFSLFCFFISWILYTVVSKL